MDGTLVSIWIAALSGILALAHNYPDLFQSIRIYLKAAVILPLFCGIGWLVIMAGIFVVTKNKDAISYMPAPWFYLMCLSFDAALWIGDKMAATKL